MQKIIIPTWNVYFSILMIVFIQVQTSNINVIFKSKYLSFRMDDLKLNVEQLTSVDFINIFLGCAFKLHC